MGSSVTEDPNRSGAHDPRVAPRSGQFDQFG
jgi:hypothetical protein